jgi:hypothetical protein
MNASSNGNYNISNSTFSNMKKRTSVLVLEGSFLSLSFSYNSFYNLISEKQGVVYFILFIY